MRFDTDAEYHLFRMTVSENATPYDTQDIENYINAVFHAHLAMPVERAHVPVRNDTASWWAQNTFLQPDIYDKKRGIYPYQVALMTWRAPKGSHRSSAGVCVDEGEITIGGPGFIKILLPERLTYDTESQALLAATNPSEVVTSSHFYRSLEQRVLKMLGISAAWTEHTGFGDRKLYWSELMHRYPVRLVAQTAETKKQRAKDRVTIQARTVIRDSFDNVCTRIADVQRHVRSLNELFPEWEKAVKTLESIDLGVDERKAYAEQVAIINSIKEDLHAIVTR